MNLKNINWAIVDGESGNKARPIKKEWVLEIKKQCDKVQVRFFFKQWGKTKFNPNLNDPTIDSKHPQHAKGGCELDGSVYRAMP